jgi:hypothetical protein
MGLKDVFRAVIKPAKGQDIDVSIRAKNKDDATAKIKAKAKQVGGEIKDGEVKPDTAGFIELDGNGRRIN